MTASGLPAGMTASFTPVGTAGANTMKLTSSSATPAALTVTVTGVSGNLSHAATVAVRVAGLKKGAVPVDLSSAYNVKGIYTDGSSFANAASLDGGGFAYSEATLGSTQLWDGVVFNLGPANQLDVVTGKTVALPEGKFSSLEILATGVEGGQESQVFTITYADGTSSSVAQSLSDWYASGGYKGESEAVVTPYRLESDGSKDYRAFHLYGYAFPLDSNKMVSSIALPSNQHVLVFALTLVPSAV